MNGDWGSLAMVERHNTIKGGGSVGKIKTPSECQDIK